jgi:methanogenic corrinoid protein MtbC1
VTDEFAREIGADGFAKDAATAANVAQELLAASA